VNKALPSHPRFDSLGLGSLRGPDGQGRFSGCFVAETSMRVPDQIRTLAAGVREPLRSVA